MLTRRNPAKTTARAARELRERIAQQRRVPTNPPPEPDRWPQPIPRKT